jgi:hypothetical protein
VRLRLVSEGLLDVGTSMQLHQSEEPKEGAVRVFVRRLLEEKFGREVSDWEIESSVLPRAHDRSDSVSGYERKVYLAIIGAAADDCSSVAVVIDRDRTESGVRLKALRSGRSLTEEKGEPLAYKTALGVAIETVEAWLLADEKALNEALSPSPPVQGLPAPEGLDGAPGTANHPKQMFRAFVKRATKDVAAPYDEVAQRVRIDFLEQRCKEGFAPFAEEVRERCE